MVVVVVVFVTVVVGAMTVLRCGRSGCSRGGGAGDVVAMVEVS